MDSIVKNHRAEVKEKVKNFKHELKKVKIDLSDESKEKEREKNRNLKEEIKKEIKSISEEKLQIKEKKEPLWDFFFDMKNKIFKNKHYEFDDQIQTDGFSCSLVFKLKGCENEKNIKKDNEYKKIEELSEEDLKSIENKTIVGCDPGKFQLVYMVSEDKETPGKYKKIQYNALQRQKESKSKRNGKIMEKEKTKWKITKIESELTSERSKTSYYNKFKDYIGKKIEIYEKVKEFYRKELWRKLNFRQHVYSEKSLEKMMKNIEEKFGKEIIIGYGNWSRNTQMKNMIPTMGKELRKRIHKKFDTITIDEYRTSKKCNKCNEDMENFKNEEGKKIHRLMVCRKCKECKCENKTEIAYRARDKNSAINIMRITKTWINERKRIEAFCRKDSKESNVETTDECGESQTIKTSSEETSFATVLIDINMCRSKIQHI